MRVLKLCDDNNDPCPHDPDPNAVPDKDGYCPKDERAGRNGSQDSVVTYNTHGAHTQSIWVQGADGRYYKAAEWAPELLQYAGYLPKGASWDWPGLDGRPYMITYEGDGRFEGVTPDGQGFWFQRKLTLPPSQTSCENLLRSLLARIATLNGQLTQAENELQSVQKKLDQVQSDYEEARASREEIVHKYESYLASIFESYGSLEPTETNPTVKSIVELLEQRKEDLSLRVDALDSAIKILQKKIRERQAQRDNIRNQQKAAVELYNTMLKACGQ